MCTVYLVLECRSDGGGDDGLDLGGGVDEVVVLPPALPDQLREPVVLLNVVANSLPQPLECTEEKQLVNNTIIKIIF